MEKSANEHPRPSRIRAYRDGRPIWLMIEPHHPRFSMSLADGVKSRLDEEGRFLLCEDLQGHVNEALSHWADEPITVHVPRFDMHVCMSDNPEDPGKVLVRLARRK